MCLGYDNADVEIESRCTSTGDNSANNVEQDGYTLETLNGEINVAHIDELNGCAGSQALNDVEPGDIDKVSDGSQNEDHPQGDAAAIDQPPHADDFSARYSYSPPHQTEASIQEDGSKSSSLASTASNSEKSEYTPNTAESGSEAQQPDYSSLGSGLYSLRRSNRVSTKPVSYNMEVGSTSSTSEDEIVDYYYQDYQRKKTRKKAEPAGRSSSKRAKKDEVGAYSNRRSYVGSSTDSASLEDVKDYRPKSALSFNPPNSRSTRKRAPVNYYEFENNDDRSESEYECEVEQDADNTPTKAIDAFIDLRKTVKSENGKDTEVTEYLIKWVGKSYRDLEWHSADDIQYIRGFGKIKKFLEDYNALHRFEVDPDMTEEDKERCAIMINNQKDLVEDHKKVHRIIAKRVNAEFSENNPTGIEYLCKWYRLGYEDCTWEPASSLEDDKEEIKSSNEREQTSHMPGAGLIYGRIRPPYIPFKKQPDYLKGGELRSFQLYGINWLASLWHKCYNGILADEMGLGKTVQTVSFLSYLFHSMRVYGPFLMIVPLGTISAWEREFAKWAPDMNVVVYMGNASAKAVIREYEFYHGGSIKFNVLLTTYENIIKNKTHLQQIKWAFLAVDEAHRLKNEASKLHRTLSNDLNRCNRLLITGTPLQNNVQELTSLIQFLMPEKIKGKDFQIDLENTESPDSKKKMKELKSILEEIMMRRLKKDVEQSLPGKTELILRIPMSEMQKKYYKAVFAKELASLFSKELGNIPLFSLRNIVVQLKKVSNHPYLFPNSRNYDVSPEEGFRQLVVSSGKMALLDKLLPRLKEENRRVLIFSQMVKMLDILTEYVEYKGYRYQRLDGTVPSEVRKRAMEKFNAPNSPDFIFLLSTRAGGLGLNLETADTVILYDLDWNPQNDLQAIGRAHRIGQKNQVNVYRLVTAESIDEDIVERAKRKMVLEYAIIQEFEAQGDSDNAEKYKDEIGEKLDNVTKDDLAVILKFGARRLFRDQSDQTLAPDAGHNPDSDMAPIYDKNMETLDLDKVLKGAEKTNFTFESGISEGSSEFINRWNAVNVEVGDLSWNELIPQRQKEEALKMAKSLNVDGHAAEQDKIDKVNGRTRPRQAKMAAKVAATSHFKEHADSDDADNAKNDSDTESQDNDNSEMNFSDNYPISRAKRRSMRSKKVPRSDRKKGEVKQEDNTEGKLLLNSKCIGDLTNAILVYGDWNRRYDKITKLAHLENEDMAVVIKECEDIWEECKIAMKKRDSELSSMLEDSLSKAKLERERAHFIMYKNIREINAQKVFDRVPQLTALVQEFEKYKDIYLYQVGEVDLFFTSKWDSSPPWTSRDDSMLLVGIYKHGFGNWKAIQDDPKLGLSTKFFLGGERSKLDKNRKLPKKLHLDRRGTYLLREIMNKNSSLVDSQLSCDKPLYLRANSRSRRAANANSESQPPRKNISGMRIPRKIHASRAEPRRYERRHQSPIHEKYQSVANSWVKGLDSDMKKGFDRSPRSQSTHKSPSFLNLVKGCSPLAPAVDGYPGYIGEFEFEYNAEIEEMCKHLMRPVRKSLKALRGRPGIHVSDMPAYVNNLLYTEMSKVGMHIESVLLLNTTDPKQRSVLEAQLFKFTAENFFLVNLRPPLPWNRCKLAWERILYKINHPPDGKQIPASNEFSDSPPDGVINALGSPSQEYSTVQLNGFTPRVGLNSSKRALLKKHHYDTASKYKAGVSDMIEPDIRSYYTGSSSPSRHHTHRRRTPRASLHVQSPQNLAISEESVVCRHSRRVRRPEKSSSKAYGSREHDPRLKISRINSGKIRPSRRAREGNMPPLAFT